VSEIVTTGAGYAERRLDSAHQQLAPVESPVSTPQDGEAESAGWITGGMSLNRVLAVSSTVQGTAKRGPE
jgi:hypothetical protein